MQGRTTDVNNDKSISVFYDQVLATLYIIFQLLELVHRDVNIMSAFGQNHDIDIMIGYS